MKHLDVPMCTGGERGYWAVVPAGEHATSVVLTSALDDMDTALCYLNIHRRIYADFPRGVL